MKGVIILKEFKALEVSVRGNDIETAMKILKKKLQKDGVFQRLKEKRYFEKPGDKKRRKIRENKRRLKK